MDTNGYVFLSYSLVDEAVAQALAAKLVGQDISVWAQTGRDFGPDWRTVIRERVLGASLFVLIASDASRTSIWVARELVWARSHRIPIETLHLLGPAAPGASGSVSYTHLTLPTKRI